MTLVTVSLSVLIFSFFFLIYTNMIKAGARLGDNLRLTVYLEDEVVPQLQSQLKKKIRNFSEVEKIVFVSRAQAFEGLSKQLGEERDVLNDLGPSFLPPSIEVYPKKDLESLAQLKDFSDYLSTLPGAMKVQYGHGWVERFGYFIQFLKIILLLSGCLLILSTTFMISNTIRLTVFARKKELETLRLLGATNTYIEAPLLIEGIVQGVLGSAIGIVFLYFLYQWVTMRFSGPGFLNLFNITFFTPSVTAVILLISILLCTFGSLFSIRKFLRI